MNHQNKSSSLNWIEGVLKKKVWTEADLKKISAALPFSMGEDDGEVLRVVRALKEELVKLCNAPFKEQLVVCGLLKSLVNDTFLKKSPSTVLSILGDQDLSTGPLSIVVNAIIKGLRSNVGSSVVFSEDSETSERLKEIASLLRQDQLSIDTRNQLLEELKQMIWEESICLGDRRMALKLSADLATVPSVYEVYVVNWEKCLKVPDLKAEAFRSFNIGLKDGKPNGQSHLNAIRRFKEMSQGIEVKLPISKAERKQTNKKLKIAKEQNLNLFANIFESDDESVVVAALEAISRLSNDLADDECGALAGSMLVYLLSSNEKYTQKASEAFLKMKHFQVTEPSVLTFIRDHFKGSKEVIFSIFLGIGLSDQKDITIYFEVLFGILEQFPYCEINGEISNMLIGYIKDNRVGLEIAMSNTKMHADLKTHKKVLETLFFKAFSDKTIRNRILYQLSGIGS